MVATLCSSETSVLKEARGVTSQKAAFFLSLCSLQLTSILSIGSLFKPVNVHKGIAINRVGVWQDAVVNSGGTVTNLWYPEFGELLHQIKEFHLLKNYSAACNKLSG
jgi:hypothetical protein